MGAHTSIAVSDGRQCKMKKMDRHSHGTNASGATLSRVYSDKSRPQRTMSVFAPARRQCLVYPLTTSHQRSPGAGLWCPDPRAQAGQTRGRWQARRADADKHQRAAVAPPAVACCYDLGGRRRRPPPLAACAMYPTPPPLPARVLCAAAAAAGLVRRGRCRRGSPPPLQRSAGAAGPPSSAAHPTRSSGLPSVRSGRTTSKAICKVIPYSPSITYAHVRRTELRNTRKRAHPPLFNSTKAHCPLPRFALPPPGATASGRPSPRAIR